MQKRNLDFLKFYNNSKNTLFINSIIRNDWYSVIFNHIDACCCSIGYTCGCNFFGCNCNYANDDYCYYDGIANYVCLKHECRLGNNICRSNERCSAISEIDIVSCIYANIILYNGKNSLYNPEKLFMTWKMG